MNSGESRYPSTELEVSAPSPPLRRLAETGHVALEDFLLQLHRLSSALNESAIFANHGIGLAEWSVLKAIGPQSLRMIDIGRQARLSRQRVSKLVKDLEKKGLVSAASPGDGDRRSRQLVATPGAAKLLHDISQALRTLDLPDHGKGVSRADRLTRLLLRSLRQSRRRRSDDAAAPVAPSLSLTLSRHLARG